VKTRSKANDDGIPGPKPGFSNQTLWSCSPTLQTGHQEAEKNIAPTPKVLVGSHIAKRLAKCDRAQYVESKILGDMGHVHGLAAVLALDKSLELKDACVDVGFEVVNFFAGVLLSNLAHLGSIQAGVGAGWTNCSNHPSSKIGMMLLISRGENSVTSGVDSHGIIVICSGPARPRCAHVFQKLRVISEKKIGSKTTR
jgi:hypothetical protein